MAGPTATTGAGPRAIPLWDARGFGAVPVTCFDDLPLPEQWIRWHVAVWICSRHPALEDLAEGSLS